MYHCQSGFAQIKDIFSVSKFMSKVKLLLVFDRGQLVSNVLTYHY